MDDTADGTRSSTQNKSRRRRRRRRKGKQQQAQPKKHHKKEPKEEAPTLSMVMTPNLPCVAIGDDIWTNNIIFCLTGADYGALRRTCKHFDRLLCSKNNKNHKLTINNFWKLQCKFLLRIPFIVENHFKPIDNDWYSFYIQLRYILFGLQIIENDTSMRGHFTIHYSILQGMCTMS